VKKPSAADRFEELVVTNLRTDLLAQAIIAILALLVSPSRWVWAVWAVRWLVVVGIAVALRASRRGRRDRALHALCGGHALGALLTVAILPEGILLGLLVVLSDLVLIARFGSPKRERMYWWIGAIVAGALSLLSLQSWTRFGQSIPRWLLVLVLVTHACVTAWLVARSTRENALLLADRAEQLDRLRGRLLQAGDDERVRIEAALRIGPLADLNVLEGHIINLADALDQPSHDAPSDEQSSPHAVAGEAATAAQSSLRSLRSLCHDISPQQLRQNGLAAAATTLTTRAAAIDHLVMPADRLDDEVEAVLYAALVDLVATSQVTGAPICAEITTDTIAATAVLSLEAQSARSPLGAVQSWEPGQSVSDRVAALDGSTIRNSNGSIVITIPASSASGTVNDPTESLRGFANQVGDHPVLTQFIDASFVFASIGMVAVAGVWFATRNRNVAGMAAMLVVVFALLGTAKIQLRNERVGVALALVCLETSGAAVAIAFLIPEAISASAMTSAVPMALAVTLADRSVLAAIAALQTVFILIIAALGVLRSPLLDARSVPTWVAAVAVPLAVVGITVLVATALARTLKVLNEQRTAIAASIRRLVRASDDERVRIERDLHDGAQQHLVSLSIQLRALANVVDRDVPKARRVVADLRQQVGDASQAMASLITGTYPAELTTGNLAGALRTMAGRQTIPVSVAADGAERLDPHLATNVYYACIEALQNVTKHAGPAATARVEVREVGDRLMVDVRDDGRGFDVDAMNRSRGLHHLRDRWETVGGTVTVKSQPGKGTTVSAIVPTRVLAPPPEGA
jgi:signal transduction histidine kinase